MREEWGSYHRLPGRRLRGTRRGSLGIVRRGHDALGCSCPCAGVCRRLLVCWLISCQHRASSLCPGMATLWSGELRRWDKLGNLPYGNGCRGNGSRKPCLRSGSSDAGCSWGGGCNGIFLILPRVDADAVEIPDTQAIEPPVGNGRLASGLSLFMQLDEKS